MFKKNGKATSAVMAGLLAVGMAASPLAPAVALATNSASTGTQTGSGQTDLTMILRDTDEHGGTAEPQYLDDGTTPNPLYNPDADGDGLGDNLAFTVPTAINYVVDADGTMTGPTNATIQNRSVMGINVSSVDVDEETPFTIVADATASSTDNSVDLQFGPSEDQLNAADYLTKTDVNDASKWEMGAEGAADANLGIQTDGHVSHVAKDITQQSKFGTIKWYLKATHEAAPDYGTLAKSWDVGAEPGTVTAALYDSGTLVFSGNGAIKEYEDAGVAFERADSPWYWYMIAGEDSTPKITSVVIEPGVTSISRYAFALETMSGSTSVLTNVTIPDSVTSIDNTAFREMPDLTINCGFAEGAVSGAPWGATNATINYNYAG